MDKDMIQTFDDLTALDMGRSKSTLLWWQNGYFLVRA